MDERFELVLQASDELLVAVPQDATELAGGQIENSPPIGIDEIRPFSPHDDAIHEGLDEQQSVAASFPQLEVG